MTCARCGHRVDEHLDGCGKQPTAESLREMIKEKTRELRAAMERAGIKVGK